MPYIYFECDIILFLFKMNRFFFIILYNIPFLYKLYFLMLIILYLWNTKTIYVFSFFKIGRTWPSFEEAMTLCKNFYISK